MSYRERGGRRANNLKSPMTLRTSKPFSEKNYSSRNNSNKSNSLITYTYCHFNILRSPNVHLFVVASNFVEKFTINSKCTTNMSWCSYCSSFIPFYTFPFSFWYGLPVDIKIYVNRKISKSIFGKRSQFLNEPIEK